VVGGGGGNENGTPFWEMPFFCGRSVLGREGEGFVSGGGSSLILGISGDIPLANREGDKALCCIR